MMQTNIVIPNIQKIIFVQNCAESGSNLVNSLLDNHSKIMSTPALHVADLYNAWQQIIIWQQKNKPITLSVIHQLLEKYLYQFFTPNIDNFNRMGKNKDQLLYIEKKDFFQYFNMAMQQSQSLTLRHFILNVFTAYNACFNKFFSDDAFILYPAHSRDKNIILDICQEFEQCYFLYTMREPVQNMGSLSRWLNSHKFFSQYNPVHGICAEILDKHIIHWPSKPFESNNKIPYHEDTQHSISRYVRLEDIHQKPSETTQKIANWLNIEYQPSLMESTFMGLLWHNRKASMDINGFNPEIIKQTYPEYCNFFDNYRFKLLAHRERSYFGYGQLNMVDKLIYLFLPLLLLFPFKMEFNKNRFYYFFNKTINEYLNHFNEYYNNIKNISVLMQPIVFMLLFPYLILWLYFKFLYQSMRNYIGARRYLIKLWYHKLIKNDALDYVKPL